MDSNGNFKKGSVEMLILHLLKNEGDCYGYQLAQFIRKRSDGIINIPEGSMYPTLYRLLEKSYISDYKKVVGERMTRVYYHLEQNGYKRLDSLVNDYYQVNDAIQHLLNFTSKTNNEDTDVC